MPDVASAGASAWLTTASLFPENVNGSGTETDSDLLTPMPCLYISGKPLSGLLSFPVTSAAHIIMSHVHGDTACVTTKLMHIGL
jgi:hypothetical protein